MIPISSPSLTDAERRNLLAAFDSTWISSRGEFLDRFETKFAARCDVANAISAANGTVALHLALKSLGVEPGDEVILPAFTYVATANTVLQCGATPVFVDVDPLDWCIDTSQLAAAMSPRTVGVLSVDIYGHPADYDTLRAFADERGLWWVSDSAEAVFAEYRGRVVGADADVTTFSFFGNKVLTSGEGGCVTTNDERLASKMRSLKNQGNHPTRRYFHDELGYNYRLTNLQAAILVAQLDRASSLIDARSRVISIYESAFLENPRIGLQPVREHVVRSPWMMSLTLARGDRDSRDRLIRELAAEGVESRPTFESLHTLPYMPAAERETFPVTERISASGLSLPTYPDLDSSSVKTVIELVERLVAPPTER